MVSRGYEITLLSLLTFLFSLPSLAGDYGANQKPLPRRNAEQQVPGVETPQTVMGHLQPSGGYYNQLPQPQFRTEIMDSEALLFDGIGTGDGRAYYCGGWDESEDYRQLHGMSSHGATPTQGGQNQGTFRLLRLIDRCRAEGCGPIEPDGTSIELGIPHRATNCHPMGRRRFWDDEMYEENERSSEVEGGPPAPFHEGWRGRNTIDDGYGFIFGRYLLKREVSGAVPVSSPTFGVIHGYNFLDIPYSRAHLRWGYLCPEVRRTDGYKTNPILRRSWATPSQQWPMEEERWRHYLDLLKQANDRLASQISNGAYGNLSLRKDRALTTSEREMSEIVVNIWNILDEMIDRMERARCDGWGCVAQSLSNIFKSDPVDLHCGPVEGGLLVESQPEDNQITLLSSVCRDVQSKRAVGSHAYYNIDGDWENGHGYASYGEWRGDGGIYERGWGAERGYRIYDRGRTMGARQGGYRPADGYSPVMASLIAHQAVHTFFQTDLEVNRMENWPAPEALWEEELAVMAQALVYSHLCGLGYCPIGRDFAMTTEPFARWVERADRNDSSSAVIGATKGTRYLYPAECRGFGEIYLGPFCNNMMVLWRLITDGQPDMARRYALYHAMGPIMDTPGRMTINGGESAFVLPEPARRGPQLDWERPEPGRYMGSEREQLQ